MKESPEDRTVRKYVLASARGEGATKLEFAPLKEPPASLPATWKHALADPDPTHTVLDVVWKPLAKLYPKTITAMRCSLQRVGLLTTTQRSHSIVYLFELEDEEGPWLRRGYLPSTKLPKIAKRLPEDFLALYKVHDGWLDDGAMMGPRRSCDWAPLGLSGPSKEFLVVFEGHGPASLGFDLTKDPPACYTVWTQSNPERVRKVAREIDEWFEGRMEECEPSRTRSPRTATSRTNKAAARPLSGARKGRG